MKILVIDDKAINLEAAVSKLAKHEVTIIDSYDKAMMLIQEDVDARDVYKALGRPFRGGIHRDPEFNAKEAELRPKFDFDIVLVDLMMPASERALGNQCEHRHGEQMPYGFPLMIKIAMRHAGRVKDVAIVSDVNHHCHAMSAALDPLGGYGGSPVMINGIRCLFIHSNLQEDGSKDWDYALKRVISPKEVLNY